MSAGLVSCLLLANLSRRSDERRDCDGSLIAGFACQNNYYDLFRRLAAQIKTYTQKVTAEYEEMNTNTHTHALTQNYKRSTKLLNTAD